MSANISKILIIGATSGIGEGFARRLHAQGKEIIITGRREDRLNKIKSSLSSGKPVETLSWDVSNFDSIPKTVASVIKAHPDLDTVYVNSGLMEQFSLLDPSTSTDSSIANEVNVNVIAVFLLARAFIPHLTKLASEGKHSAFLVTSSGLAYTPMPLYPVYCATKAAIHSFMVSLRQQVAQSQDQKVPKFLSICEIAPPMVATDLGKHHTNTSAATPMTLDDFLDDTMKGLSEVDGKTGKLKKEIAPGTAGPRLEAWRKAYDPILEKYGLKE